MNRQEKDILTALLAEPFINQRILSEISGYSLGIVNRSLKNLLKEGYLNDDIALSKKAYQEFHDNAPRNAIILAAGFGMRMVPINFIAQGIFICKSVSWIVDSRCHALALSS